MSTATETDLEERIRHDAEKAVETAAHKARITQDEEDDEMQLSPFNPVRFPLAFNTPNLLWDEDEEVGGITVYSPVDGDYLLLAQIITTEGWDTSDVRLWLYLKDSDYLDGQLLLGPVDVSSVWNVSGAGEGSLSATGQNYRLGDSFDTPSSKMQAGLYLTGLKTIEVVARREDGGAIDESTQGKSEVVLSILKAP